MKGRAAVFSGPGRPLKLREFPVPDPEAGAVLVRVSLCNVCGSDVHPWTGGWDLTAMGGALPTVLGHEMVGIVEALGARMTTDSAGVPLRPGDRVVYAYFQPCRRCEACLDGVTVGCWNLRMAMLASCEEPPFFVGGFADYFLPARGRHHPQGARRAARRPRGRFGCRRPQPLEQGLPHQLGRAQPFL